MRRVTILGCALAVAASLVAGAPALALTTVGRSTQSAEVGSGCLAAAGCDFIQIGGAGTSDRIPFDGVLTGYTIRNGSVAPLPTDTARLSVYRGGNGRYALVAQTPDNTLRPFARLETPCFRRASASQPVTCWACACTTGRTPRGCMGRAGATSWDG